MTNDEFRNSLISRSIALARNAIHLVDTFPNRRSSWVIVDQLIRANTSVGANIVEAQAASSSRDFINFLTYALKSGNEAKFWLILAKEVAPHKLEEIEALVKELSELTKILGSSIVTLKGKNKL